MGINGRLFIKFVKKYNWLIQKLIRDIKNHDEEVDPIGCALKLLAVELYQKENNGEECPRDKLDEYMIKVLNNCEDEE